MRYNEDKMMLSHNTFGDRFETWYNGDRIVTCDLDGEDLFLTFHKLPDVESAKDMLIRTLANEVMNLQRQLEGENKLC